MKPRSVRIFNPSSCIRVRTAPIVLQLSGHAGKRRVAHMHFFQERVVGI
jgi:hypothetical protein